MNACADLLVTFDDGNTPTLTRLGNPWTHESPVAPHVWASCGPGHPGPGITAAGSGRWTVRAVGEVFAYRGATTDALGRFAADLDGGRADPNEVDAQAVLFAWDQAATRLHVWVDRMGTVPVYAGGPEGRRRVGTSFAAVSEASARQPDWVGITGFCGFGFYPADRTPFEDVRILRPAAHHTFDAEGRHLSATRYWEWPAEPVRGRPDDALVDDFHDRWTSVLDRQIRGGSIVVPLSGGLDSRTIVGTVSGPEPIGETSLFAYGYGTRSPEVAIARAVTRARGVPLTEQVVPPYLLDRLDTVHGAVEGFSGLSFTRQAGAAEALAGLGDRVVGGHWGDVWFDDAGATALAPGRTDDLAAVAFAKFAKRGREWLLDHLCRPHLAGTDPEDVLRDILTTELARLDGIVDPDTRLKALKTEQWSFRWTLAGTRAYELARPVLLPFYANDLVDLFTTIPGQQLRGRRLQVAYLLRHHPDLAAVRWDKTGLQLAPTRLDRAKALSERLVRKAGRVATRRPVVQRNWEVQYLGGDRPGRLCRGLTAAGSPVVDLVGRDAVTTLLDDFFAAPGPRSGHAVDALLTLQMALGGGASSDSDPRAPR